MLYMLGALQLDTFPFNADQVQISSKADIAKKKVIGGISPGEFMGDGGKTLTISGQILPLKIGGLTQLDMADQMRKSGEVFPVMRGDGIRLGNFAIKSMSETHKHLARNGVGHVVTHRLTLQQEPDESQSSPGLVPDLLSIFDIF